MPGDSHVPFDNGRARRTTVAGLVCSRCGTAGPCAGRDVVDFRGVYWTLCSSCAMMVSDWLHGVGDLGGAA